MEKILLAPDPGSINMNIIDFACYLSRLTHSRLTGVFLEDPKKDITEEYIRAFKVACDCRGVQTLVHRDRRVPFAGIVEESRFADIVVLDAEISFTRNNESLPGWFVKDVLVEFECPVIIAPYSFDRIDTILFPMTRQNHPYMPSNNLLICFLNASKRKLSS